MIIRTLEFLLQIMFVGIERSLFISPSIPKLQYPLKILKITQNFSKFQHLFEWNINNSFYVPVQNYSNFLKISKYIFGNNSKILKISPLICIEWQFFQFSIFIRRWPLQCCLWCMCNTRAIFVTSIDFLLFFPWPNNLQHRYDKNFTHCHCYLLITVISNE